MATRDYTIKHPQTGQTITMTGDRIPNEAEIKEAFAAISNQTKSSVAQDILQAPQRTEERIASREDLLKQGADRLSKSGLLIEPRNLANPIGYAHQQVTGLMESLGGASQRYEAMQANPIIAMQEGWGPEQAAKEAGQGISGERLGEYGDVYLNLGLPENVAAAAGLLTAVATDPTAILRLGGTAARRLAMLGTRKTGQVAAKTAKQTGRAIANASMTILETPPRVKTFALADNFEFAQPKYWEPDAARNLASDLIQDTNEKIYKPASEAFENIKASQLGRVVPEDTLTSMADDLSTMLANEIASPSQKKVVNRVLKTLYKAADKGDTVDMGTVLDIHRGLRSASRGNIQASKATNIISEHLRGLSPEFDEASKLWSQWTQVQAARDVAVGKTLAKMGKPTSATNAKRIQGMLTDDNQKADQAMQIIQNVLGNKASKNYMREARRISAAHQFRRTSPSLKPFLVLGPAAGAAFMANKAVGAGITAGSAALTSPKFSSSMFRKASRTSELMRKASQATGNLATTPLAQEVGKITAMVGDTAIQREVTGRNRAQTLQEDNY